MFLILRRGGLYDTWRTVPTVFYLTREQADRAAADATDFVKRAGLYGRIADDFDPNVLYGDDDGSDRSWRAHVEQHGGLPAADPDLSPEDVDFYGIHEYRVCEVKVGRPV